MKTYQTSSFVQINFLLMSLVLFFSNCKNTPSPGGGNNSGGGGTVVEPAKPPGQPALASPICQAAQQVLVTGTVAGATVTIYKNETAIGTATAVGEETLASLTQPLVSGDNISAKQSLNNLPSPVSSIVEVTAGSPTTAQILGGEPFFKPENNEQPIGSPVFLRGKASIQFAVNTCCAQKLAVEIKDPKGKVLTTISPATNTTGSLSISWEWKDKNGQQISGGIPVGKYIATIKTGCEPKPIELPFFVIFDPAENGGAARFSFNETNVWFGAHTNASRALLYQLHPDDTRIFNIAIEACSGATDQVKAAQLICDAEEKKFAYSLAYHTNDVLDLLARFTETQCADDANFLAALYRSVGIPSRTATADAALETGEANWTFDTWTEFWAKKSPSSPAEWLIFHPHEYADMSAETRAVFGKTRGVATKKFNDIMIVASEIWKESEASDGQVDVSYDRNECNEPGKNLTKKSWLTEVSDQGYWEKPFFDCDGIIASRDLASKAKMELDMGDAGFGRTVSGSIVLPPGNPFSRAGAAPPNIQIVGDLPESKKFPDTIFFTKPMSFSKKSGQPTANFDMKLPATSPAGMELWVVSNSGKKIVSAKPISLANALKVQFNIPKNIKTGSEITIEATLLNETKAVVNNVNAQLGRSFYLTIIGNAVQNIGKLNPGETKKITWNAKASAPIEADEIRLLVNSSDGGGVVSTVGFSIKN